jgi:hypothetical protein
VSTGRSTNMDMDGDLGQPDSAKHRSSLSHSLHGVGVGDRGQRYEVRYTDSETGKEKIMGWTDKADGGGLLRAAVQWPAVKERPDGTRIAWVVDRHTGEAVVP